MEWGLGVGYKRGCGDNIGIIENKGFALICNLRIKTSYSRFEKEKG